MVKITRTRMHVEPRAEALADDLQTPGDPQNIPVRTHLGDQIVVYPLYLSRWIRRSARKIEKIGFAILRIVLTTRSKAGLKFANKKVSVFYNRY